MYSTISADIVHSTKLTTEQTIRMKEHLQTFLDEMKVTSPGSWGRIVKGDALECVLTQPGDALRIALMMKCHIKRFESKKMDESFKTYGMRIAIAIGDMRTNDESNGIIDGEAIYKSGRMIDQKQVKTKGTIFFDFQTNVYADIIESLILLCDVAINKSSFKQCEILYHKLSGKDEESIAAILNKKRPTVNEHSRKAGWYAIEKALDIFEKLIRQSL